jgi:fructan beta-fructosidase
MRTGMQCAAWLCGLLAMCAVAAPERPDITVADFEGSDYGNWTVSGEAFGAGPAQGALPNQMPVDGFLGKGLVNSYRNGDGAKGTLSSPSFLIERRYLKFLVGGGGWDRKTCINLLADGRVVRSTTGLNTQPGGSERLDWAQWDVGEFAGKSAVIEIVDDAAGGWGHINVDQIVMTDKKQPGLLSNPTRELKADKHYLNLPVKNGAPKRWVSVLEGGRVERDFEIELAESGEAADWWAFVDLTPFTGKTITVRVDKLADDSAALAAITTSDTFKGEDTLYREALRPQFHFSPRRGWNNDPNGLVYYKGEYHLFFQHNPYGWNWGNMQWGHAVSPDLIHWQELDEAVLPDALGTAYSGSAVVDEGNTAGFAQGGEKAIVCMYTAAGGSSRQSQGALYSQCLCYSTDRGRTWTKYANNPVLRQIAEANRDPKVIWYAPQAKWVMALYLIRNDYALFESPDLKQWTRICDVKLPGGSECPEFFEIPVDPAAPDGAVAHGAKPGDTRWVFYGGNGLYLVGRFDGKTYTPESGPHPLNGGNCFYASQTYNGVPDGRRVLVPWGQVTMPGMPFNQMMGIPVALTLRTTEAGLRLSAYPVREVGTLRGQKHEWKDAAVKPGENLLAGVTGDLFDMDAELVPGGAEEVGFNIRGFAVAYDAKKQELRCGDKRAALKLTDGKVRLRLLVDRMSVDVFGNDGRVYMPMQFHPSVEERTLGVFSRGGEARLTSLDVFEMKSAW